MGGGNLFGLKQLVKKAVTEFTSSDKMDSVQVGTAKDNGQPEILFLSSYPPRECGIATYTANLISALDERFSNYFNLKVCALEPGEAQYFYNNDVAFKLDTSKPAELPDLVATINQDLLIELVVIQHEFDLLKPIEKYFVQFLYELSKPVIVVFHTIPSNPSESFKQHVQSIALISQRIVVMTENSAVILEREYQVFRSKIEVIPYGTQVYPTASKDLLKEKYQFTERKVLLTFGLLTPLKGIETILEALPAVIKQNPEVILLVIGKTHPETGKQSGEDYRIMLESKTKALKLQNYVKFMNSYLVEDTIKEYLQVSDICIFSATDLNRSMSGTMALAAGCGCSILSTRTPHALDILGNNQEFYFESNNPSDLSSRINFFLNDTGLKKKSTELAYQKAFMSSWQNAALFHDNLFRKVSHKEVIRVFKYPSVSLEYLKTQTDNLGIRESVQNPSRYSSIDNAFALVVFCMHYKLTGDADDLDYINRFFNFIQISHKPDDGFFEYFDKDGNPFIPHDEEFHEDSCAFALWSLGYLLSLKTLLPATTIENAEVLMDKTLNQVDKLKSARAIAIALKGIYYYYSVEEEKKNLDKIRDLAGKLIKMYWKNSNEDWNWFEDRFTTASSIISGALLNTWLLTGDLVYKDIAQESFEFWASKLFNQNQSCLMPGNELNGDARHPLEKSVNIGFNVVTLSKFYLVCKESRYYNRMNVAFDWFMGNNRLNLMVYNPATRGCFDGLDENSLNFGENVRSALSYCLARLIIEKYKFKDEDHIMV